MILTTHRELSESYRRQPGIPPSECDGELDPMFNTTDTAQALDGMGVGDIVAVELWACEQCLSVVVVRHAADGWRISNDWGPK